MKRLSHAIFSVMVPALLLPIALTLEVTDLLAESSSPPTGTPTPSAPSRRTGDILGPLLINSDRAIIIPAALPRELSAEQARMSLDNLLRSLEKELGVTIKELKCSSKIECSLGGADHKPSPQCAKESISIWNASLSSVLRIMVTKGVASPLVLDRGLDSKVSIVIGCAMSSEAALQIVPDLLSSLNLIAVPLPNNRQFITSDSSDTVRVSRLPAQDEIVAISKEGKVQKFIAAPLSGESISKKSATPASPSSSGKALLTSQDFSDALANFRKVSTEYRSVPYFRQGAAVGIRLFAVRSGGIAEKLGLRNGDIIMSVDSNPVLDGTTFSGQLQELLKREKGEIELERGGTKIAIVVTAS